MRCFSLRLSLHPPTNISLTPRALRLRPSKDPYARTHKADEPKQRVMSLCGIECACHAADGTLDASLDDSAVARIAVFSPVYLSTARETSEFSASLIQVDLFRRYL